jgi:hypothetical protein
MPEELAQAQAHLQLPDTQDQLCTIHAADPWPSYMAPLPSLMLYLQKCTLSPDSDSDDASKACKMLQTLSPPGGVDPFRGLGREDVMRLSELFLADNGGRLTDRPAPGTPHSPYSCFA